MESSLTAPVRGRVREVLVSANTHVPSGRPLLQIEPLDDQDDGAEGERLGFDAARDQRRARAERAGSAGVALLGYDVPRLGGAPHRSTSSSAAPADPDGERRLLEVYADLRAVSRPHAPTRCRRRRPQPAAASARVPALARPAAEGLPERFVAGLERALRHYGIEGLERTAALEAACYRLFLSRQRAGTASACGPRRCSSAASKMPASARRENGELREVLDRLEAALAATEPGLAELAREVRWRLLRPAADRSRRASRTSTPPPTSTSPRSCARPDDADREEHVAGAGRLPAAAGAPRVPADRRRRARGCASSCWRR